MLAFCCSTSVCQVITISHLCTVNAQTEQSFEIWHTLYEDFSIFLLKYFFYKCVHLHRKVFYNFPYQSALHLRIKGKFVFFLSNFSIRFLEAFLTVCKMYWSFTMRWIKWMHKIFFRRHCIWLSENNFTYLLYLHYLHMSSLIFPKQINLARSTSQRQKSEDST